MYKLYNKCSLSTRNIYHVKVLSCSNRILKSTLCNEADLDIGYVPSKVAETNASSNYFQPSIKSSDCFKIILPPPNITGTLHLGHALTATVQDVIVRWNRMRGVETVWIPGMDHAGIATQVVVEKKLWKEKNQTRHDVGRADFEKFIWNWKEEKENIIEKQLRRLNISLDWDKEVFTMDQQRSEAVTEAFVRLFEAGLIYRAGHLVNWSCVLQSAISDIEVEHVNVDGPTDIIVPGYKKPVKFGVLTSFAYKLEGTDEEIIVATTRPETMLGDVAVAVNPNDSRYSRYVGRKLWHPFRKESIPIVADDFVDVNFGTGAVKLTPAHDHADFEAGKRHNLKTIQVIDESGRLTQVCGEFARVPRFDARDVVLDRLAKLKLLRGKRDHQMIVPICSRSKDVVEFLVRPQWFIKCDEMAKRALDDVKEGRLTIEPGQFDKIWFNWLENIRDWCISRQLWWGHRIPAYECSNGNKTIWVAAKNMDEARSRASSKFGEKGTNISIRQDEDVLDTWFSSSLLPFSAFGWPKESDNLSKHYPLSLMETGHDILFFWVARMVMLGRQLTGQLPFNKVLLHGIICDAQGRKMSKSLGNVIAPEEVINGSTLQQLEAGSRAAYESGVLSLEELHRSVQGQKKMFPDGIPECGADALRFTLCSHNIKSHFINFDISECHTNKLFGNKIWQATKFTKLWFNNVSAEQDLHKPPVYENLSYMDKWILSRLDNMVTLAHENFSNYNFHAVTFALKSFLYFDFCDVYLESTKRGLRASGSIAASGHIWTLLCVLDIGLRVLAPFMPTLSAHLHQRLPMFVAQERRVDFPEKLNWRDENLERDVENIMEIVVAIRRLKKVFNVVGKHKPEAYIISDKILFSTHVDVLEDLSSCYKIHVHSSPTEINVKNTVVDNIGNTILHLVVPEELKKSLEMDLPKMEKKKEKLMKELDKINKMVAGSTYKTNATPEAQESHSKKIASLQEKLSRINYIQSLTK